ncbi:MAG: Hsp20/alpha crystallin family protein [Bacteroidota bacterium]|nr:Hsp20/alpha crystallin family protein [Bacteroidota bacterium]MEC8363826.1 Hsp20/alpha crystallin family protein [Bacteroidota bacterium]MED5364521.1 Hsp20/alpha crystallin family protein [Bacteroidota bacterium]|tara:strand:+ start:272 stop:697 length:426 start_codon:yes stop_codon:yes gene_type:complete
MNLVHRNTDQLFTSIFDDFFGSNIFDSRTLKRNDLPSVNILDNEKFFELNLAAPGKNRKDFIIELEDQILTISSESFTNNDDSDNFTRQEYRYGNFKRSFRLPDSINTSLIKAKYENGILSISLPKHKEAIPEPKKQIEIK